jgi:hypothetical protein
MTHGHRRPDGNRTRRCRGRAPGPAQGRRRHRSPGGSRANRTESGRSSRSGSLRFGMITSVLPRRARRGQHKVSTRSAQGQRSQRAHRRARPGSIGGELSGPVPMRTRPAARHTGTADRHEQIAPATFRTRSAAHLMRESSAVATLGSGGDTGAPPGAVRDAGTGAADGAPSTTHRPRSCGEW